MLAQQSLHRLRELVRHRQGWRQAEESVLAGYPRAVLSSGVSGARLAGGLRNRLPYRIGGV
jgi:hypothetical protein